MTLLPTGASQSGFDEGSKDYFSDLEGFHFISESPAMKKLYRKLTGWTAVSDPVLILGASGTGKETAAREIFIKESRPFSKFIKLDSGRLSSELLEERLFSQAGGLLESGSDNILFVKGLESWSAPLREKLFLRLLNYRKQASFPRLIFSANEKLPEMAKSGEFPQKLFEILSRNLLILPRLSEREEDIPAFVALFNRQNGWEGAVSEKALRALKSRVWRGNVSELKSFCGRMAEMYPDKDLVEEKDLACLLKAAALADRSIKYNPSLPLENMINLYIQMSLRHFRSKKKSAEALGISVKTIYNKIRAGCIADLS